jgi:hypothetical protein
VTDRMFLCLVVNYMMAILTLRCQLKWKRSSEFLNEVWFYRQPLLETFPVNIVTQSSFVSWYKCSFYSGTSHATDV